MMLFIDESGQSMLEYALIVGFISVAAIVVLLFFGMRIRNIYTNSDNKVESASAKVGA